MTFNNDKPDPAMESKDKRLEGKTQWGSVWRETL